LIFVETRLPGAFIIELEPRHDERGFFARTYCAEEFARHGLTASFPQCNVSYNRAALTMRGMHFNASAHPEAKLVRCTRGAIHDVIVDLRPDSATRRQWIAAELSEQNHRMLYVPEGFAHGFLTLAPESEVFYQMGALYAPDAALGFRYDDPSFAIPWPEHPRVVSERDATYPDWNDKR
jgi:dTDP-4-dehydrorhamnose 3,5-epimerase